MTEDLQKEIQVKKDAEDLQKYGYAQQLFRDMGGFSNFAISFSVISIITGGAALYGYGYGMGGAVENTFGWPLVCIFTLMIAAGMAELASAIPLSGGVYHWAYALGGRGWGWFSAWFNIIGQFAIIAGIDFGCAQFVAPLLGISGTWHNFLIIYAILLVMHGLLNHYGIRLVAFLNDLSAVYHMVGVALLIGALLIFGPKPNIANVFQFGFTTYTGPFWLAFMLGLLQAQWTFTGYDGSCNMTEETVNPRIRGAWGIYMSVMVSAVFGYAMLFVVTLMAKNNAAVAAAANPFIYVIENALGGVAGQAVLWMVTIAMWFCGLACITSSSRIVYSFARDGGMPLSKYWARIHSKYRTPSSAVWMLVVVAFLLALWSGAYSVIVSISTIGLYISYIIPLFLKLLAIRKGVWKPKNNGPWSLGKWSNAINFIAVVWGVFICILFMIPPNQLTAYTIGGAFVLLIIYYYVSAKRTFKGPAFAISVRAKAEPDSKKIAC
jgi:amino acid transporter